MILDDLLSHSVRLFPSMIALQDDHRAVSWTDFAAEVHRLAQQLTGLGLLPSDRIAVLASNRIAYVALYFAAARVGIVTVPLNNRLTTPEIATLLADAQVCAVFSEAAYRPVLDRAKPSCPTVRAWIDFDATALGWQALNNLPLQDNPHKPSPAHTVVQMYTSGTTGTPKGALLSHQNIVSKVMIWVPHLRMIPGQSRYLQVTPLFHIGGLAMMMVCAARGTSIVLQGHFEPDIAAKAFEQHRITHGLMVPAMLRWMLADRGVRDVDFSSLQLMLYGASPMPVDLLTVAIKRLGCDFLQGYGLTESTALLTALSPEDHRFDGQAPRRLWSAGRPILGIEVRVVDSEDNAVASGIRGEIVARGPNLSAGYWNRPEDTAHAHRGGWFHTGDIGRFDDEGYLYIVDRLKDMIIVGGENVYPREVEQVLSGLEGVAECAVIGVPHAVWGESVLALVVGTPPEDPKRATRALIRACRLQLAQFKCPTQIRFVETLPRNAAGKVKKAELRAPYWQDHQRLV